MLKCCPIKNPRKQVKNEKWGKYPMTNHMGKIKIQTKTKHWVGKTKINKKKEMPLVNAIANKGL